MPSSGLDDLAIAQQACTRVGIEPIAIFEGDTAEQKVLTSSFETHVRAAMTSYPFSWARQFRQLFPSATEPLINWEKAFLIPAQSIDESALWVNEFHAIFQRHNDFLFANTNDEDEVVLEHIYRVGTSFWPPLFTNAVVWSLAALLKSAVQENAEEALQLNQIAHAEMLKAYNADSSNQTNHGFELRTYGRVRRGGSRQRQLR